VRQANAKSPASSLTYTSDAVSAEPTMIAVPLAPTLAHSTSVTQLSRHRPNATVKTVTL
jgi:hypothetical protein